MNRRIISLLTTLVLCLLIPGCTSPQKPSLVDQTEFKYTMYVGLNDKDTYRQIMSDDEAQLIVSQICLKYVEGYTFSKRQGAYKDKKGIVTMENSLVYEFYSATDEQIKNIMDEALVKINQNSILVEKASISYKFYEGVAKK